jgi:hypothetical protein
MNLTSQEIVLPAVMIDNPPSHSNLSGKWVLLIQMLNISLLKKTTLLLSYTQRVWIGQWGKVCDVENVIAG